MKSVKLILPALIVIGSATLLSQSAFATNWYQPRCASGTLKKQGNKFHCLTTQNRTPSCPRNTTLKRVNVGKDKCQTIPNETVKNAECKLAAGQKKKNWRHNPLAQWDNCTHKTKKGKGIKTLKCSGSGFALVKNKRGRLDQCVKGGGRVVSTHISCRRGETHKTGGLDKCVRITETRPTF